MYLLIGIFDGYRDAVCLLGAMYVTCNFTFTHFNSPKRSEYEKIPLHCPLMCFLLSLRNL